jgi:hypothetical protein
MSLFNLIFEEERLHTIYNSVYADEFHHGDIIKKNKNVIIYASGWNKGINRII